MKITIIILLVLSILSIFITGNWNYVSSVVLPNTTWGLYNKDFFENLLVEIHGGILDLLIVGVILYWFDKRRNKKETKKKAEKTLDYLRFYNGSEASFLFYGALRELLSLGVNSVTISNGNLSNLKIKDLNLISSKLIAVNFSNSTLTNSKFTDCDLEASQFIDTKFKNVNFENVNIERAKFINSKLNAMDFTKSSIISADFKNSELKSSIFKGVDCSNVSFKGSNLRSANFIGAKNITKEMIREAKDYKDIKGISL
jgi:BTB/POZ domain-containing protein KCTD9